VRLLEAERTVRTFGPIAYFENRQTPGSVLGLGAQMIEMFLAAALFGCCVFYAFRVRGSSS
jgi:hypothetical protein